MGTTPRLAAVTTSPVRSSVSLSEVPDTIRSGTADLIEAGRQPEEAAAAAGLTVVWGVWGTYGVWGGAVGVFGCCPPLRRAGLAGTLPSALAPLCAGVCG